MANIIWQFPSGSIAITTITDPEADPVAHAQHMREIGAAPAGSIVLATNYEGAIPPGPIENLRWTGSALGVKPVPAPTPSAAPAPAA